MWFLWQNRCFDVVHFLPKYLRIQKKYLGMDLAAKLSRLVYKKKNYLIFFNSTPSNKKKT